MIVGSRTPQLTLKPRNLQGQHRGTGCSTDLGKTELLPVSPTADPAGQGLLVSPLPSQGSHYMWLAAAPQCLGLLMGVALLIFPLGHLLWFHDSRVSDSAVRG